MHQTTPNFKTCIHRPVHLLIAALLTAVLSACGWLEHAESTADTAAANDGPYIHFQQQDSNTLVWQQVCDGTAVTKILSPSDVSNLPIVCPVKAAPTQLRLSDFPAHSKAPSQGSSSEQMFESVSEPITKPITKPISKQEPEYLEPNKAPVVVLSDLHGQFDLTQQLLQAHGVIDAHNNWRFGDGQLVILGDIMGRGPHVTDLLWLFYQLEQQAGLTNGAVHLMLGNHESLVFQGDERYVHERYAQSTKALSLSYQQLFDQSSVLGRWLREQPVLLKLQDVLFVHAGVSEALFEQQLSIAQINQLFQQNWHLTKKQREEDPQLKLLFGRQGPLWYRGYFSASEKPSQQFIDKVLATYQVQKIVVGHTSFDQIYSHYQQKVIAIDSSIKKGKRGEILLIRQGQLYRGDVEGKQLPISPYPGQLDE